MQSTSVNIVWVLLLIGCCTGAPNSLIIETESAPSIEYEEFPRLDVNFRILGGSYARKSQFPYQVLLIASNSIICGGTIISENYVLTAAHCIRNVEAKHVSVRAGSIIFNYGGTVVLATKIKLHDKHDLALLQLETPLTFDRYIQPIEISAEPVPEGAPVIVSGWGGTANNGPLAPQLKFNTLYALNTNQCQQLIGSAANNLLCLSHSKDNGACGGDSGGPAVYNNTLVGVANFVINYCGSEYPDGYASVSMNYDWIIENSK